MGISDTATVGVPSCPAKYLVRDMAGVGWVGHRPVLPQPVSGGTLRLRHLPSAISCSYTPTWPALALMPFLSGLFWYQLYRQGYEVSHCLELPAAAVQLNHMHLHFTVYKISSVGAMSSTR